MGNEAPLSGAVPQAAPATVTAPPKESTYAQLRRGAHMAWRATTVVVQSAHLRTLQLRVWWLPLVVLAGLYIQGKVLLLPLRFLIGLLGMGFLVRGFDELLHTAMNFVPFAAVLIMRYVYYAPLDNLYLETAEAVHPRYAADLRSRPIEPTLEGIWKSLRRMCAPLGKIAVVYVLSLLPVVGPFVYPAAEAYVAVSVLGVELAVPILALQYALGALGLGIAGSKRQVTNVLIASRALVRELMEPHFTRFQPTDEQRRAFKERYGSVLIGFGLPFMIVSSVSFIGPLSFTLAQAAMAVVMAELGAKH